MRILIMVHNLTGGGAERVATLWATGFVQRGYKVGMVLNSKRNTPATYVVPDSVKMYNLCGNEKVAWVANKLHRRLHYDYYYIRRLRNVLQDFQPDVVIGVLQPWAEWARKATKGMNVPIINTEHNSFERPANALYNPMTQKLYKLKYELNRRYAHVTVLTEADCKCLNGLLRKVSVLPNPLAFTPVDYIPKKENVILAAGRLDAWHVKGFDVLIKAWGKIAQQYPTWILQIAGYGKDISRAYLQRIVDENHLSKQLEFLGYQDDMLPVYQSSSIFVLSSRYEGFGMVLIEAMSQGCAPIACDYKGRQREIITSNDEGVICPVENVDMLAKAISRMIEDENYRHMVQKNAIERAKNYSLEKTMDRWEEIIDKVKV